MILNLENEVLVIPIANWMRQFPILSNGHNILVIGRAHDRWRIVFLNFNLFSICVMD